MRQRKTFDAPILAVATQAADITPAEGAILHLPSNPSGCTTVDLTKWLGNGIDDWVWASLSQLGIFLSAGDVTPTTVSACARHGLEYFFRFLVSRASPCRPDQLSEIHIKQFLTWLLAHSELKITSQKQIYHRAKAVIVGLAARGVVPASEMLFPQNPFPHSNASCAGVVPLSASERTQLAEALRADIVAIHKGMFARPEGEALTVFALAIALRTGLNLTPLLELRRNCLHPHPFMPNMMRLESFKRRGSTTQLKNLRFSKSEMQAASIPMDGVTLIKIVLEKTEELAKSADADLRNRMWIYRSGRHYESRLTALTECQFACNTNAIIQRHRLLADSGEPLRINTSRLRKTMEQRLWHLSNGDIFAVAGIMGHTPKVADTSYLACTHDMRRNATFVGEALPEMYRSNSSSNITAADGKGPTQQLVNTPVGSCKDSLFGDRAPKNGSHCSDFLSCFSCRSYAIVGSKNDLIRLFSFYWFLDAEYRRSRSREWTERFILTMELIDTFTQDKFDRKLVAEAKEAASIAPIRFWKTYNLREAGGQNAPQ